MTETLIKSFTLLFIAVSTVLAIMVYYRNKRLELENSLFKSRLEAIGNIQMEMTVFLQQVDRAKVILKNKVQLDDKKLFELSLIVDEQVYKCEAAIVKWSAYFSSEAVNSLLEFTGKFYLHHSSIANEFSAALYEYESYIKKEMEPVIGLLRREAGVDSIHGSLMKRLLREKEIKV